MTDTGSLQVSNLDFDTIKSDIIDFYKSQNTFKDYNFDGAGLSVLIDNLAYNTHYLAMYINMAMSECFLSTATLRNTVVARAKYLGYIPYSQLASTAVIHVDFTVSGNPNPAIIDKGTQFTAKIDNKTYVFTTLDSYSVSPVNNKYSQDLNLIQGQFVTQSYTVDNSNPDIRFIISNANVDYRYITVSVKSNAASTTYDVYEKVTSVLDLDGNSLVYFLEVNETGLYEVKFGDGIIGKNVETDNVVKITYLISDGSAANGAALFQAVGTVGNSSSLTITTVSGAAGGSDPQSIDNIKLIAPNLYQAQERAVTEQDYTAILLRDILI